jgi:hypothetical protein
LAKLDVLKEELAEIDRKISSAKDTSMQRRYKILPKYQSEFERVTSQYKT